MHLRSRIRALSALLLLASLAHGAPLDPNCLIARLRQEGSSYLERSFTTPEENSKWIDLALRDFPQSERPIFLDVQNSALRRLNTRLQDKDLVTSLTNLHKEIFFSHLAELEKRFPRIQVHRYSDFKSARLAITGEHSPELAAALKQLFEDSNRDFNHAVHGLRIEKLKSEHPERWFKCGGGYTFEEASNATAGKCRFFWEPEVFAEISRKFYQIQKLGKEVRTELGSTRIFDGKLPSREAIQIFRKSATLEDFRSLMRLDYGSHLSERSIDSLYAYLKGVDEFSPGILIAVRETVNLNEAVHGGISADFVGMGARNLLATAEGLESSVTLTQALFKVRQNERRVTSGFLARKELFKGMAAKLKEHGLEPEIRCSGDDCAVVPVKALSIEDKKFFLSQIERSGLGPALRLTFIPEGVPPSSRTLLSVHGESIEKEIRKTFRNKRAFFAVDMEGTQLGTGGVSLWMSRQNAVRLSPGELAKLRAAFEAAVRKENPGYRVQGIQLY